MNIELTLSIKSREDIEKALNALCIAEQLFDNGKEETLPEQMHEVIEYENSFEERGGWSLSDITKSKMSEAKIGRHWWTNGVKTMQRFVCPGDDWHRGRGSLPRVANRP